MGSDLQVLYTCFVYDNADAQVVYGCIFYKNTGIVYIPKALFNESDFDRIQMQALIVIDISEGFPKQRYFYVIALITEEIVQWSGAEDVTAIQGCTIIYKVASDSVTGYVTINKTFEEQ